MHFQSGGRHLVSATQPHQPKECIEDVRNDMNTTEDFFETVAVGHIIAATLQFFGMQGLSDTPHNQSLQDAVELPHAEKWLVLSTCIGDLLQKFVSSSLACPHHEDFSFDTSEDMSTLAQSCQWPCLYLSLMMQ